MSNRPPCPPSPASLPAPPACSAGSASTSPPTDIGGGIAQHLGATTDRVARMVLMNAVTLDSWPVPAVERFRDPQVRAATTTTDRLEARRGAPRKAVARQLSDAEVEDYVSPRHVQARTRSWTAAMAAAADARYTQDLVPALVEAAVPTRLVWGRDDAFQKSGVSISVP